MTDENSQCETQTVQETYSDLLDAYEWLRRIEPTDEHCPQDVIVRTYAGMVEMDRHVHTLDNHGLSVERIGFDRAYGAYFYCQKYAIQ
jgi:hypothetical protein